MNMPLPADLRLKLYYYMRLTRACERAIIRLYKQGKIIGGAYTGAGNEATSVGSAAALGEGDVVFPMHRDLGAHLVRGQSLTNILLQQLGRAGSLTRGRDGTGHYADPSLKIYGNVSHLAAMIPMAAGVALASKLRREGTVVLTYIGEGGSNVGEFHEGLNFAAVMKLPLVLVIENNQFAYSTPTSRQYAAARLADRAVGYGIPGRTIDGTDVETVYATCVEAVERARKGEGPTLIESVTMRLEGHSVSDDASYVHAALLDEWKMKDPIARYETSLLNDCILTEELRSRLEREISAKIEEAVTFAEADPLPEGKDAAEGVYAR